MILYIAVSTDIYELPIAVADSPKELGDMVNKTSNYISSAISKNLSGKTIQMKFLRVDINEELCETN